MNTFVDLTGHKFGKLTILRFLEPKERTNQNNIWLCRCDCGNTCTANTTKLRSGHTTSCGCKKKENKGHAFEDLTGLRYGKLTVIRFLKPEERKHKQFNWLCKCDCGNEIITSANKLKCGNTKSCGCLKAERIGNLNRKYQYTNKKLYGVYKAMVSRCVSPENPEYHNYGGRGIKVCDEWLGEYGYDSFASWALENGYNPKLKKGLCTIDRINVNGDYEPDNCTWITNKQQQNNKRNNHFIVYNGETHTVAEWSEILDIPYKFMEWRLVRSKNIRTIKQCIEEYRNSKFYNKEVR